MNITFSQDQSFHHNFGKNEQIPNSILSNTSQVNQTNGSILKEFEPTPKKLIISKIDEAENSNLNQNNNSKPSQQTESEKIKATEKLKSETPKKNSSDLGVINNSYSFSYSAKISRPASKSVKQSVYHPQKIRHSKKLPIKNLMNATPQTPINYSIHTKFAKNISESKSILQNSSKIQKIRSSSKNFRISSKSYLHKKDHSMPKFTNPTHQSQNNWRVKKRRKPKSRLQNASWCRNVKPISQIKIIQAPNSYRNISKPKNLSAKPKTYRQKRNPSSRRSQIADRLDINSGSRVCASGIWNPKTQRGTRKRSVIQVKNKSHQSLGKHRACLGKSPRTFRSGLEVSISEKAGAAGVFNTPKGKNFAGEYGSVNQSKLKAMEERSILRSKNLENIQRIIDRSREILKLSSSLFFILF